MGVCVRKTGKKSKRVRSSHGSVDALMGMVYALHFTHKAPAIQISEDVFPDM